MHGLIGAVSTLVHRGRATEHPICAEVGVDAHAAGGRSHSVRIELRRSTEITTSTAATQRARAVCSGLLTQTCLALMHMQEKWQVRVLGIDGRSPAMAVAK